MPDLDRALARAYALRKAPEVAGTPPSPHFPVDTPPPAALNWPETVLALEHRHGDRFEQMAEALVEGGVRKQSRVLLFTSCHRAEGRTTLVLTLARALSRRPIRTLVVDADLS